MSQLIDRWEGVVDAMAQRLVEAWEAFSTQIGDRPLWNEQLPERTQARQYQLVRNDPQAWATLMHEHGYIATVEYMQRGERLSAKYPDEEASGQDAKTGEAIMAQAAPPAPAAAPASPPAAPVRPLGQQGEINLNEGQIGAMNGRTA